MNIADHCPLEKPLIQENESDQEPMKPALTPPSRTQTDIANSKSQKEAARYAINYAIEHGLYSNQDALEEDVRARFRLMMKKLTS